MHAELLIAVFWPGKWGTGSAAFTVICLAMNMQKKSCTTPNMYDILMICTLVFYDCTSVFLPIYAVPHQTCLLHRFATVTLAGFHVFHKLSVCTMMVSRSPIQLAFCWTCGAVMMHSFAIAKGEFLLLALRFMKLHVLTPSHMNVVVAMTGRCTKPSQRSCTVLLNNFGLKHHQQLPPTSWCGRWR